MLKLNPYKIGFRTIKTAVGMTLGVIISKLLGLDNYASSAILVVLCIKHTKVHSLQAIISRLVSCFLVLFLGSAIFSLLGQSPIVLGIIVLLFIPLTVVLKVQEGVITSCVILLHVFNAKSIDAHLIVNETLLLLIGLSIAFTMNLMMPSLDKQLDEYKCKIEQQIADIFSKYSYICEKYEDFVRNENSYYHYFDMREEQVELLMRMKPLIESICHKDPLLNDVASLLKEIGLNVNSNDYTAMRLHNLYETRLKLDELPLPTTHKALNSRASIIQILNELEEYLQIKSQFGSLKMHSEVA